MSVKRIAVIGRGTAGAQAIAHMERWFPECELKWSFDPLIPTKAVGEGSNLAMPSAMATNIGFGHRDLKHVDGTFKIGIYKEGWGSDGKPFFHDFPAPNVAYHFDALKLQDYILEYYRKQSKIRVEEITNLDINSIDADFIVNCTGKPSDLSPYQQMELPVNSVYVSQCEWDGPRFDFTLTVARPYGWVFGIPLRSRCSIGYLYNKDITSLDEVKEDVEELLKLYELKATRTNQFSFDSYIHNNNFSDRLAYNGDKSFFLEPLEATSTHMMDRINRQCFDVIKNNMAPEQANQLYKKELMQIYTMIMLHYAAGSKYTNKFWAYAKDLGERAVQSAFEDDEDFTKILMATFSKPEWRHHVETSNVEYGTWFPGSFMQNINGLGINNKLLDRMFNK